MLIFFTVTHTSRNRYTVYFYSGAWMRAQVVSWGMNVYVASVDSTPSNAGSGREYSCGLCGNFDGNPANDSPGFRVTAYAPLWPCMKVPSIATRPRDGATVTFGSIWDWVSRPPLPSLILVLTFCDMKSTDWTICYFTRTESVSSSARM